MSKVTSKTNKISLPRRVRMKVGILDGDAPHGDDGQTIGQIAEQHEFGLGNVPERSFIRAAFDEQQGEIRAIATEQMQGAYRRGAPVALGAELAAQKAAAMFQNRITDGIEPDLAESTKARKRAKQIKPPWIPLIETGVLKSSIAGDVEVTP